MDKREEVVRPESPGCRSAASSWSAELPVNFKGIIPSEDMVRPKSPGCRSAASDWSAELPINFKHSEEVIRPESPGCRSAASVWSAELPVNFKGIKHRPNSHSFRSTVSNCSSERSSKFNEADPLDTRRSKSPVLSEASMEKISQMRDTDNISSSSQADSGYSEPSFRTPEHRQRLQYAKPEEVACDLCEGRKFKACKSCMTCLASFCEIHVQDHYRTEALQRHVLVEVTKSLDILQENARLKKTIKTLTQRIKELTLPDYICKGKTPVAANVTLDPNTAHCSLMVSDDQKRVHLGEKRNVHNSVQRFDKCECVLGSEGFRSGRHYWEVKVNREFTVGVTRQSSQRKGKFTFSPSGGYWCLYYFKQVFTALEDPVRHLPIDTVPQVLGVCVDVEEKWVMFYNTETKAHIHTFRGMSFTSGEKIYPVFSTLSKAVDLELRVVK